MQREASRDEAFTDFVKEIEPRLRFALAAAVGQDRGRDAAAEALAYAWEHWDRIRLMENPAGYLYRVGRSKARLRRRPRYLPVPEQTLPHVEPGLPAAMRQLSEKQRVSVLLVHALGYTHREAADVLGVSATTVENHLGRGLAKLRAELGVQIDA